MRATKPTSSTPVFISWRWRVLLPLFALTLLGGMVGMYLLAPIGDSAAGIAPSAAGARLQLVRLFLASAVAVLLITVFVLAAWTLERINRVRRVLDALAAGESHLRTGMKGTDEIGLLGQALDRYASHVQDRHDGLRAQLRRQRREAEHLSAVLEAVPAGIIVQDLDGRVISMNERARELLGSDGPIRTNNLQALTEVVTDALGPALAPGLHALGDARRVVVDKRTVSAQAAAVMSLNEQRVGTVIVLHDVTDDVQREQAHGALLDRLANDVQTPLSELSRASVNEPRPMRVFAREMTRHAVALQKLIVEMRELTAEIDSRTITKSQRALPVDTLVWGIVNEWRQVAQAANLQLQVTIERQGLFLLGDERRLRWAIGNIVDNAIKYTPPGGQVTVETSGDVNGRLYLRVKDTGVGISEDDLPNIFTRFYRGKPRTEAGRGIHVAGAGQGLSIAREIIEAHGGSVRVKSTLYAGTSVYVSLPLTAPMTIELPRLHNANNDMEGETVRLNPPRSAAAVS